VSLLTAISRRLASEVTESITALLSKGNIRLFTTTLIEGNAMKRLITLIFSAALLCPMWSFAGTTTTATTPLNLQLSSNGGIGMTIPITYVTTTSNSDQVSRLTNLYFLVITPNNINGIFSVSGYANVNNLTGTAAYSMPLTGTIVTVTNNSLYNESAPTAYSATFIISSTISINCILNINTFLGTCIESTTGNTSRAEPIPN
jgi:hypothetical protein